MISPREFFANMYWPISRDGHRFAVFSRNEILTYPLKWLKYLLLARTGLTTESRLSHDISRFSYAERAACIDACREYYGGKEGGNRQMTVIKKVFWDQAGQLPNCRLYSSGDLTAAVQFLDVSEPNARPFEVWLCRSSVDIAGSNFGGRAILSQTRLSVQTLEVVWFASPRLIEDYKVVGFQYPFAMAERKPGELAYRILHSSIPTGGVLDATAMVSAIQRDLGFAARMLEQRNESIHLLTDVLHGAGAGIVSVEFKCNNGEFHFIDWDTEVESSFRALRPKQP